MARNLNMAAFAALAMALVISSVSAATYEVGDGLGWNVPPGGDAAYANWGNKTFHDGDILVFKFASGQHDVAKVTKEAFNACNITNPISLTTTTPANITLTSGKHYFICTFANGNHCKSGQRLAVNVTGTTSPAPAPATISPAPCPSSTVASPAPVNLAPQPSSSASPPAPVAPAPSPSVGPTTYTVGDTAGWNVLGNDTYSVWARNKNFRVGDVLVFNFINGTHDVAEVTKTNFDSCTIANPISHFSSTPVRITLNKTGDNYFICTFPSHCSKGQKLAINVAGSTASPAPSPSGSAGPSPTPSTSATPPSPGATPPSTTGATPPSGTTTPSTPAPASNVTPPPSPSAATSLGISAFCLSIAVALFMF